MRTDITSRIVSIGELFGQERAMVVPSFQRQYSWTLAVVSTLLHDLIDAFEGDPGLPYFMGGIILSANSANGYAPLSDPPKPAGHAASGVELSLFEIVDGQQRIATFSFLIAVLRDLETHPDRERALHMLLALRDPPIMGERAWRVTPGFFDKTFFEHTAQIRGATRDTDANPTPDRDSWRRMHAAITHIREAMMARSADWRHGFCDFLLHSCLVDEITLRAPTIVFHVFNTMNARGQRPQASDLLKSALFQHAGLGEADARDMSNRWHEWENTLGDRAFEEMFGHIRTILDRNHRGQAMESLVRAVRQTGARAFLETRLPGFVAVYQALLTGIPESPYDNPRITAALRRLKWLDHQSWRPVVMVALARKGEDRGQAERFFARLERLAFSMQLTRPDREERRRRYRRVLDQLQARDWADALDGDVNLSEAEQIRLSQRLRMPFGDDVQSTMLYLLNDILAPDEIARFLANGGAKISVEHVLPRRPDGASAWRKIHFPNETEAMPLVNQYGNLALAPEPKNRLADRKEFSEKVRIFSKGGTEFATCRDLPDYPEWNPAIIRARTERFAAIIEREWEM